MWRRSILAVWILLAWAVQGLVAYSDPQDNLEVIIGASIAVTLVIIFIIIGVACFCYLRAVKKIRTKIRMRQLISCKYRSKMIITPESTVPLDDYFKKEGLDIDSLFMTTDETVEDIQQLAENVKEFDEGRTVETENERQLTDDILHTPNKVKKLYEEHLMITSETISEYAMIDEVSEEKCNEDKEAKPTVANETEGPFKQLENETCENKSSEVILKNFEDDKSCEERFTETGVIVQVEEFTKQRDDIKETECININISKEPEKIIAKSEMSDTDEQSGKEDVSSIDEIDLKETSRDTSPVPSVSQQRKVPFLSLPEINQFFDLTNTCAVKKTKKNKNRQNSFRKSSNTSKKHPNARSEYQLAYANIHRILMGKNRPRAELAKELKLFSSQILVSQRLKKQNLLYSRISLPHKHQVDKEIHIPKKENKKKTAVSQKSPNHGSRNWNPSRASEHPSNRPHTSLSVSDIGIGLR